MASLLLLLVGSAVAFSCHFVISLLRNIFKVRAAGLPYAVVPYTELEDIAFVLSPIQRRIYAGHLLKGRGWPRWIRFTIKDWAYEDRLRAHEEYGGVFLVVSPWRVVCYVADSDVASRICMSRRQFVKLDKKYKILEPFGPNVVSSDGDSWKRYQQLILPAVGDELNRLVWDEASRLAEELASSWSSQSFGHAEKNMYGLTLSVMTRVEYGKWAVEDAGDGFSMSMAEAISTIVDDFVPVLLLPRWLLRLSPWKRAHTALQDYENHMRCSLAQEQRNKPSGFSNSILGIMAKSLAASEAGSSPVTVDEIIANLFMFHVASYDTTSLTLCYAILVLCFKSSIQDRVIKELERVNTEAELAGRTSLSYKEDFPKLRYTLALMYESLRVFPTVLPITRYAPDPVGITLKDDDMNPSIYSLPAKTCVIISTTGTNNSTKNWRQPNLIEPRRWLKPSPNDWEPSAETEEEVEDAKEPIPSCRRGTFMTFNEGPHTCLGRKVAQAEFVAVISQLLKKHRLELATELSADEVRNNLFLRAGGSPITLIPPIEPLVKLVPRM